MGQPSSKDEHASGRFDCFRSNVTSSNQTCYAAARFATFRRQRTTNHTHGKGHVLVGRHRGNKAEILEHHAQPAAQILC